MPWFFQEEEAVRGETIPARDPILHVYQVSMWPALCSVLEMLAYPCVVYACQPSTCRGSKLR